MGEIRVPTLVVNARNDPFVPIRGLASQAEVSPLVTLDYPDAGGHVGFPSPGGGARFNWIPARLEAFFRLKGAL